MKKLIVMLFICAAGVAACGKKIMPESDANNPARSDNDKEAKSGSQPETTTTTTNTSATTTPSFKDMSASRTVVTQDVPKYVSMDQEKTVYVTKCNTCHALKNPGDYTTEQMKNILKAEIPKAKLNKKEADQVTAYLLANTKK